MADNIETKAAATIPVATDVVTYSGDTGQNVQLMRPVHVTGSEGSKTVVDAGDTRYGFDADVTRLPPAGVDTFGKLMVVNAVNDIDVQFYRDLPENLVTVTAANGGTATTVSGLAQLATSTATNGQASATSKEKVWYRSGGEVYAMWTQAFPDGGVAGCNATVGLTDGVNGFYAGYSGTTYNLYTINAGSETAIPAGSWNGDVCDGSAGSRFTRGGTPEAINHTLLNVWRVRFGWLGAAPIRFEVLSPDGEWVTVHTVRQPNTAATPSIANADLPIRATILKTSGATNVRLNTACWGAGTTYDKRGLVSSATLGTATNSAVSLPVLGVGALVLTFGVGTTGSAIFEAYDGYAWITHPACWAIGAAGAADTQVTAAVTPAAGADYRLSTAGFRQVRVRTTSTLGAVVPVNITADALTSMVMLQNGAAGNVAHDAVDGGNPLKVGQRAVELGATPTAVAAADRADWLTTRAGVPFMLGGHPNIQSSEYFTSGAITDDNILPAVAAGTRYVITGITVTCSAANATSPSVRIGFGTSTLTAQGATNADAVAKIILSHPGIPAGSGIVKGYNGGIVGIGASDEELRITCTTPTTSLIVQVDWFTIAA